MSEAEAADMGRSVKAVQNKKRNEETVFWRITLRDPMFLGSFRFNVSQELVAK